MNETAAARKRATMKARRERWKADGLCTQCGGPRDLSTLVCSACVERSKASNAKRIAEGRCKWCGKPATRGQLCDTCHDKHRAHNQSRVQAGKCYKCGDDALPGYRHCAKHLQQSRDKSTAYKLEALAAYGGSCACCGESNAVFLCIDHTNGGGNEHRRAIGSVGGQSFYTHLRRSGYPDGYRVLCHNCNAAFAILGYCPHHPPVSLA